jgi:hypothetical protein
MAKERDWAGFFAALAKFLAEVLPVILPLFTGGVVKQPRPKSTHRPSGSKKTSPPDLDQ